MLVDAQIHAGPPRYRSIDACLDALTREGVDAAVLVHQMGAADNALIADAVAAWPDRLAGVAGLPDEVRGDGATAALDQLGTHPAFSSARIPASLFESTTRRVEIAEALERTGLVATVQGVWETITSGGLALAVHDHPSVQYVIEHVGGYRYSAGDDLEPLLDLGRQPNVILMWSCFYRFSVRGYPYPDATPILYRTLETFGPGRIIWSGDLNRAEQGLADGPDDYRRAVNHIRGLISTLTGADQSRILGDTAVAVYRIGAASSL